MSFRNPSDKLMRILSVLMAGIILYSLIRATYYTHQPAAKMARLAALLVAQVINLCVNLEAKPRQAFQITTLLIAADGILNLLFMP